MSRHEIRKAGRDGEFVWTDGEVEISNSTGWVPETVVANTRMGAVPVGTHGPMSMGEGGVLTVSADACVEDVVAFCCAAATQNPAIPDEAVAHLRAFLDTRSGRE